MTGFEGLLCLRWRILHSCMNRLKVRAVRHMRHHVGRNRVGGTGPGRLKKPHNCSRDRFVVGHTANWERALRHHVGKGLRVGGTGGCVLWWVTAAMRGVNDGI